MLIKIFIFLVIMLVISGFVIFARIFVLGRIDMRIDPKRFKRDYIDRNSG